MNQNIFEAIGLPVNFLCRKKSGRKRKDLKRTERIKEAENFLRIYLELCLLIHGYFSPIQDHQSLLT